MALNNNSLVLLKQDNGNSLVAQFIDGTRLSLKLHTDYSPVTITTSYYDGQEWQPEAQLAPLIPHNRQIPIFTPYSGFTLNAIDYKDFGPVHNILLEIYAQNVQTSKEIKLGKLSGVSLPSWSMLSGARITTSDGTPYPGVLQLVSNGEVRIYSNITNTKYFLMACTWVS